MTTLPYGSWTSPISARSLAVGGNSLGVPRFVGDALWWAEGVAAEGGRQAIVRQAAAARDGGVPHTVLPEPWNARSRVHEYGGAAWTVLDDVPGGPVVLFVNFADQRVYAFAEGAQPRPLTPEGPDVESAHGPSLRWVCPTPVTAADGSREVWWVCEDHTGAAGIERYVAAVPLDGSAAQDASQIRRVTPASRFVAFPRVSPDGSRIAWTSWEHPQMPWDGTELHVAALRDGVADGPGEVIAGDAQTSVLQPEWLDAERLAFVSDASGWWNPAVWSTRVGVRAVLAAGSPYAEQEWAEPMWSIGTTSYHVLGAGRLLASVGTDSRQLVVLDVDSGAVHPLHAAPEGEEALTDLRVGDVGDGRIALVGASPTRFRAVFVADLLGGEAPALSPLRLVRSSRSDAPDPVVLPTPRALQVPLAQGGVVHAIYYPPHNDVVTGPDGERPPVIAKVHGGPTSQAMPTLQLPIAYYTSRGLGVVDVNYGGSAGYGRAYRDRLKGQWGVVDVADTVAVMDYLVAEGLADPDRLGIEGGSAGGWTTLACLTRTDTFSAGVSSFGVAELENFVKDTHDFESRYVDGLVGPYPECADLYAERAPLNHVDELDCPVLLLQGDEDRIVPPSQSEMFRDALAAKGIPHAYLLFEGEQHGFRKAETIVRAAEASLSFYGQVFGFTPPDVPALELRTG
ncbi:dipeptidyl-peptidase 5 [Nigerium massiliense]|uniref:dipeptidyl-peptidase 5 n=1 Tax=Nigerium massiliense TaxID=1522317 RepID=UPI00058E70F6|nr:prolyl oligopeptidase family serine peptidase [Nigerium massiliense]